MKTSATPDTREQITYQDDSQLIVDIWVKAWALIICIAKKFPFATAHVTATSVNVLRLIETVERKY